MTPRPLTRLRQHLAGAPSERAWRAICDALDDLDEATLTGVAIPYVQTHAATWPDAVRYARPMWLYALLRGVEVPQLAIARKLGKPDPRRSLPASSVITDVTCPDALWDDTVLEAGAFGRLLEHPALSHITHIALGFRRRGEGSAASARTIASAALPNLEHLALNYRDVSPDDLLAMAEAPWARRLKHLELRRASCATAMEALVRRWPFERLTSISMDSTSITSMGVARLAANHAMTAIRLSEVDVAPLYMTLARIGPSQGLETLALDRCPADPPSTRALARAEHLRSLTTLELRANAQTLDASFPDHFEGSLIANAVKLEIRVFRSVETTRACAAALAHNPSLHQLRDLTLMRGVDDASAVAIAQNPALAGLESINFGDDFGVSCSVGPKGVAAIATLPLRTLRLAETDVGDEGMRAIAESPALRNLETLELIKCRVGPQGASALAASENLASVRTLDLRVNPLGEGVKAIVSSPHLHGVEHLVLVGTDLDTAGIELLCARDDLTQLRSLTISHNRYKLTLEGARALTASTFIPQLDYLGLPSGYDLSPEVAAHIAAASHWPEHLKVSTSRGMNPWSWSLLDYLHVPPSDASMEALDYYIRCQHEAVTKARPEHYAIIERWWPDVIHPVGFAMLDRIGGVEKG